MSHIFCPINLKFLGIQKCSQIVSYDIAPKRVIRMVHQLTVSIMAYLCHLPGSGINPPFNTLLQYEIVTGAMFDTIIIDL